MNKISIQWLEYSGESERKGEKKEERWCAHFACGSGSENCLCVVYTYSRAFNRTFTASQPHWLAKGEPSRRVCRRRSSSRFAVWLLEKLLVLVHSAPSSLSSLSSHFSFFFSLDLAYSFFFHTFFISSHCSHHTSPPPPSLFPTTVFVYWIQEH